MSDALPPLPEAVEVALADLLESQFNLGVRTGRQGPRATTADKAGMQHSAAAIQRAVDAIRAALAAPAVPPGWQLVPVEPTEEMLTAGLKRKALALWKDGITPFRASTANLRPVQEVAALQWAAMLAAAPTAQQEPKP